MSGRALTPPPAGFWLSFVSFTSRPGIAQRPAALRANFWSPIRTRLRRHKRSRVRVRKEAKSMTAISISSMSPAQSDDVRRSTLSIWNHAGVAEALAGLLKMLVTGNSQGRHREVSNPKSGIGPGDASMQCGRNRPLFPSVVYTSVSQNPMEMNLLESTSAIDHKQEFAPIPPEFADLCSWPQHSFQPLKFRA